MKTITIAIMVAAVAWTSHAAAQSYTHGYMRRDGTYVQGYYRSSPNDTRIDNYSTRGNVNPYTGQRGTRDPYDQFNTRSRRRYSPTQPTYRRNHSDGIEW